MKPRRVRAYLLSEVLRVPAWEADRLRDAVQAAFATEIADLERELDALRRRASAAAFRDSGALLRC